MKNLAYHLFHNSKYFRLASCRFSNDQLKANTARLYFQQQEQTLSFTCENSLGLYFSNNQTVQMQASDWQNFGASIIHSMLDIYSQPVQEDQNSPSNRSANINIPTTQSLARISPSKNLRQNTKVSFCSSKKKRDGVKIKYSELGIVMDKGKTIETGEKGLKFQKGPPKEKDG